MTSAIQSTSALQFNLELYAALDRAVIAASTHSSPNARSSSTNICPARARTPDGRERSRSCFSFPITLAPHRTRTYPNPWMRPSRRSALTRGNNPLTIPELSNLVYVIGALTHVEAADPAAKSILFSQVLKLAAPTDTPATIRSTNADALLELLQQEFYGMEAWDKVIAAAAAAGWVKKEIAKVPKCGPAVVTVNGYESVLIDAELIRTPSRSTT